MKQDEHKKMMKEHMNGEMKGMDHDMMHGEKDSSREDMMKAMTAGTHLVMIMVMDEETQNTLENAEGKMARLG